MALSFKNKILFKSKLEEIVPFNKLWYRKDFSIKCLFEDPTELSLFQAIIKFDAEHFQYQGTDKYNMIRLTLERLYSEEELDKAIVYLSEIEKIKISVEEMDVLKNDIDVYIREVLTFNSLVQASDTIEKVKTKQYADVSKEFYSIFDSVEKAVKFRIDSSDSLGLNLNNLNETMIEEMFKSGTKIAFPKQLHTFNLATEGGFTTQTLNVVAGPTYTGKTRFLLNMCAYLFLAGHSVVYHTLEISQNEIMIRIMSILLAKKKADLRKLGANGLLKLYNEFKINNNLRSNLFIKQFQSGYYSICDLKDYMNDMENTYGEEAPKVYMVDGLNNMASDNPKKQNENSFFLLKDIVYKMQGLAVAKNKALWSSAQLSKDTVFKVGNKHTSIQEGFSIIQGADFNVIIENTDEMEKMGFQAAVISKNRYSKPYKKAIYMQNKDPFLFNLLEIPEKTPEWNECDSLYQEGIGTKSTVKF